jgi:hypothetical protein
LRQAEATPSSPPDRQPNRESRNRHLQENQLGWERWPIDECNSCGEGSDDASSEGKQRKAACRYQPLKADRHV